MVKYVFPQILSKLSMLRIFRHPQRLNGERIKIATRPNDLDLVYREAVRRDTRPLKSLQLLLIPSESAKHLPDSTNWESNNF